MKYRLPQVLLCWLVAMEEEENMADYEIFELQEVILQAGLTLRQAKVAYKTYGQLNAARDNVIVMPTFYGAQHAENETLMAAWPALDPKKYFIIVPNMFGNGLSSSPSNTPSEKSHHQATSCSCYTRDGFAPQDTLSGSLPCGFRIARKG